MKGNTIRGIEHWTGKPTSVNSTFILSSEDHAMKRSDKWVLKKTGQNSIVVRNRFTNIEIEIPKKAVIPVLRRPSGLKSIDITQEVDFAVVSRFQDDERFFIRSLVEKGKSISKYVKDWRQYLKGRTTNLVVSRRFNLSAPNTKAMAFFTETKISPCKMFWAIRDLDNENSKILALWFNSTMNISQIISKRAETEGAFMGLSKYILQQFSVLDPTTLNKEQKERLIKVFNSLGKTKLPSIYEQMKTKNKVRKKVDLAIMDVLNIRADREGTLDLAYESLSRKIEKLANLMGEGELD